jgi:DNA processing protein
MRYDRDDSDDYPTRLRALPDPPRVLTTTGALEPRGRIVAIVGARAATPRSVAFAFDLARALAQEDVVVISGGAIGVDTAAHRGALAGGGRTWAVLPTGRLHCAPRQNQSLFDEIAGSPGSRLVWPLPDEVDATRAETFRYRNAVLTALADDVVVVQAHLQSGSLNAASWARQLGRRTWTVPAPPWSPSFAGSNLLLSKGHARPIWFAADLLAALLERPVREVATWWSGGLPRDAEVELLEGAPEIPQPEAELDPEVQRPLRRRSRRPPKGLPKAPRGRRWTEDENCILSVLSAEPRHLDTIALQAALGVSSTVTALLTLALEDVVVEGPDGFFRLESRDKSSG